MQIKTEITISAAHFVQTTKTACKRLHGHNWKVEVTVRGVIKKDGMVVDFIKIKDIINKLDHKFLVPSQTYTIYRDVADGELVGILNTETEEIICIVPEDWIQLVDVPVITAEHLAEYICHELRKQMGSNENLSVKVWESEKSFALMG